MAHGHARSSDSGACVATGRDVDAEEFQTEIFVAGPHSAVRRISGMHAPRRLTQASGCVRSRCLQAVATAAELQALSGGGTLPVVLHFWASWAPMCSQTTELAGRLAGECPNVRFGNVEAEEAEVRLPLHHALNHRSCRPRLAGA